MIQRDLKRLLLHILGRIKETKENPELQCPQNRKHLRNVQDWLLQKRSVLNSSLSSKWENSDSRFGASQKQDKEISSLTHLL